MKDLEIGGSLEIQISDKDKIEILERNYRALEEDLKEANGMKEVALQTVAELSKDNQNIRELNEDLAGESKYWKETALFLATMASLFLILLIAKTFGWL